MAISAQQIQAVLAANPNATQAQIEKAMANYGVTPREFLMATGVDPARYSGNAPAAGGVYTPAYNASTPVSPAPVSPMPNPVEPPPAPAQRPAGASLSGQPQYTQDQIQAALANNPNATPADIQRAMANNNVTPEQMQQALGSRQTGAIGGYADNTINDTLTERFLESGPLSAQDVNRAGIRYGIGREQMANIDPRLMEQTAGLAPARQTLNRAGEALRGDYAAAQQYQAPYREVGQEAAQRQAALTGALGPEAQQQAFDEYQSSPALGYLQEQSERALMRNAAAMGGLGGGNVRQDLTKLTADLYGQDFQNQVSRLGDIATRGYGAAGTSAGLGQNMATGVSNLGAIGAGYQMQTGRDISGAQGLTAANMANLQTDLGNTQAANLVNLQNQQIGAYNLGNQYGTNAMNQGLATQSALAGIGNAYAGVPGQQYTPVPAYDLGGALTAGGNAYDLAGTMFPGQGTQAPNYVMQSSANRFPPRPPNMTFGSTPNSNLQLMPGVSTQSLLPTF
jgi:hypothetical protein